MKVTQIHKKPPVLQTLSHVSIVVPDLEVAVSRLKSVYGLHAGPRLINEAQGVTLAYVTLANVKLELMQPLHSEGPLTRFLQKNPKGGLHHISFDVESLDSLLDMLAPNSVQPVSAPGALNVHGDPIAFLHPKDFLGVLVEMEQHSGHNGCQ
jgi:methylmalonyl-CoA/ethylmalonyl-CoA epimerase